jgi:hypothetical protein
MDLDLKNNYFPFIPQVPTHSHICLHNHQLIPLPTITNSPFSYLPSIKVIFHILKEQSLKNNKIDFICQSDGTSLVRFSCPSFNLKNPNIRETEIDFEILIKIGFHFFFYRQRSNDRFLFINKFCMKQGVDEDKGDYEIEKILIKQISANIKNKPTFMFSKQTNKSINTSSEKVNI